MELAANLPIEFIDFLISPLIKKVIAFRGSFKLEKKLDIPFSAKSGVMAL